jgi:hypothetical protein
MGAFGRAGLRVPRSTHVGRVTYSLSFFHLAQPSRFSFFDKNSHFIDISWLPNHVISIFHFSISWNNWAISHH